MGDSGETSLPFPPSGWGSIPGLDADKAGEKGQAAIRTVVLIVWYASESTGKLVQTRLLAGQAPGWLSWLNAQLQLRL